MEKIEDTQELNEEIERLWNLVKAQQACMREGRHILFTDVWVEDGKIRFSILTSSDERGAEYGANIVAGYIIGMMEAAGHKTVDRGRAAADVTEGGRTFRRLKNVRVWACIETGEVRVFGDPREVEPPEWNGDPTDEQLDSGLDHNCDTAGCNSVSHTIVHGHIAGRGPTAIRDNAAEEQCACPCGPCDKTPIECLRESLREAHVLRDADEAKVHRLNAKIEQLNAENEANKERVRAAEAEVRALREALADACYLVSQTRPTTAAGIAIRNGLTFADGRYSSERPERACEDTESGRL